MDDAKDEPLDDGKFVEGILPIFSDWWEIIPLVAAVILVSLVLTAAFMEIRQRFFSHIRGGGSCAVVVLPPFDRTPG